MSDPITPTTLISEDTAHELAMAGLDGEGPAPNENEAVEAAEQTQAKAARRAPKAKTAKAKTAKAPKAKPASDKPPRAVKRDEVLAMLARKRGVTVKEITAATEWQAHTIRAFISTVPKKIGLTVSSEKNKDGERVYRTSKPTAELQTTEPQPAA